MNPGDGNKRHGNKPKPNGDADPLKWDVLMKDASHSYGGEQGYGFDDGAFGNPGNQS